MSALPRTDVREALCAMRARHARHGVSTLLRTYLRKALRAVRRFAPCGQTHSALHRRAGMCCAFCWQDTKVSALPRTCRTRSALCRRDTHVYALPRTYVRAALRDMLARHALVSPAPHSCATSASRYAGETRTCLPCPAPRCCMHSALCRRVTHVSALPCTDVLEALCFMLARYARVCPAQHICVGSAPRYEGETRTFLPCPAHRF